MNIATPYAIEFNHKEWINEYNIIFKPKNKTENLINFLISNQNKRINLWFKDDSFNIDTIITLNKIHEQLYIVFRESYPRVKEQVGQLIENNIKFYFDMYAANYTDLNFYLSLGCSDVWIWGDLMYNLDVVRSICNKNNCNMRIILNRIPSSLDKPDIKSPFFRPQDLDLVEQYFDTVEFICGDTDGFDPTNYDWKTFKVLYRHWFERIKWIGELKEINLDIDFDFPCMSMPKNFFVNKLNCDLKCYKDRRCNHCTNYYNTALALREKGLAVNDS